PFVRREVHTRAVELTRPEQAFYAALDRLAPFAAPDRHQPTPYPSPGESVSAAPVLPPLVWLTLKREACSSPHAASASLRRLAHRHRWPQLEELARQGESVSAWAKGQAVAELVRSLGDEHVLVFTEYSATQQALAHCLARLGRPVVLFSGGLSPLQREWAQAVFQSRAPVMVCTDAAAEGLNLQFCRHLINADLPWNPMRIEQRIGRVHRLGQTRDVHVWNLYVKGTVDEYVLYLLHEKLNLFRSVVGELEAILESLGGGPAFEEALRRGLARLPARAPGETGQMGLYLQQALEELVRQWNAALKRYTARLRRQQALLDEAPAAGSARSWP
ncbi:MAG TPA: C-terminal helicase domain-containing protein, partial [Limnochordales bacterium]